MSRLWHAVFLAWCLAASSCDAYSIAEALMKQLHQNATSMFDQAEDGILLPALSPSILVRSHAAVKDILNRLQAESTDEVAEMVENESKFEYWKGIENATRAHLELKQEHSDVEGRLCRSQLSRTDSIYAALGHGNIVTAKAKATRDNQIQSFEKQHADRMVRHKKMMEAIFKVSSLLDEQIETEQHVQDSRIHFPIFNHLMDVMMDKFNVSLHQMSVLNQLMNRMATHNQRTLSNITTALQCSECTKRSEIMGLYNRSVPAAVERLALRCKQFKDESDMAISDDRVQSNRLSEVMTHINNTHVIQATASAELDQFTHRAKKSLQEVESFFKSQKKEIPHSHMCIQDSETTLLADPEKIAVNLTFCGLTCANNNLTCAQRCVEKVLRNSQPKCSLCVAFASQCFASQCVAACTETYQVAGDSLGLIRTVVNVSLPECGECARKSVECVEITEGCT